MVTVKFVQANSPNGIIALIFPSDKSVFQFQHARLPLAKLYKYNFGKNKQHYDAFAGSTNDFSTFHKSAFSIFFFLPFLSHTDRTTLHLMTHIKQFPMSQMSPAIFQKGRQAAIHPFRACVGSLQGHQQDRVTFCHPCVWKQSSHPRRSTRGLLRTGE